MAKRTVTERVEEFKSKKSPRMAKMSFDEMSEIAQMFGPFLNFCDAFKIINTAFYLGYIKGQRAKKGGAA